MATRKPSPRNRALRPAKEDLESRQLLSAIASGTDIDGDTWTFKLTGPGSLTVVKQNGPDGNPAPLNSTTEISQIVVGGTDPLVSRLIGIVRKGPNGDGKVFFNTFDQLESHSEKLQSGLGLLAVNMPGFWLGNTFPTGSTPTAPTMTIPDGVDTLRFGGVDTTHNQVAATSSTPASNPTNIELGLPAYGGTRVIIDKSISSTQQVPSTTAGQPPTTAQFGVLFAVSGRLDLFQANSIEGDANNPPGQFNDQVSTASGTGGTIVVSGTNQVAPFLNIVANLQGAVTGQIGDVRVGGNATNFSTVVFDNTGTSGAKISNFSVGGETNNVLVVAPNGMQNAAFGKGMDTTDIVTHVLNKLQANRGALNSNVYVDRTISQVLLGGDVVNTNILTGFSQNFSSIFSTITGQSSNPFAASSPSAPPQPTNAQTGGGMSALVAGNITDSVFTASVSPDPNGSFGDPHQIILPTGHIAAKVQGVIVNANATPNQPNTAFYANQVHLVHGPVVPPNVPEAPYGGPMRPIHAPGLHHPLRIQQLRGLQTNPVGHKLFTGGVALPRGPLGRVHQVQ
jgi:hypothetical protein